MKAEMKKKLTTMQEQLVAQKAIATDLREEEAEYANGLDNDDKLEESEGRQELLSELEESLDVCTSLLYDLLH